jgi:signal transduction histidine kinase
VSLQELNEVLAQQKDELRKNEIARQEFLAMITHELKTPLVSIIGYGSMFLHGTFGELPSAHKKTLQIMYDNARGLADLIQDILDVQKLELGELRLDMKHISARDMIIQSINSLRPFAELKRITLSNTLDHDIELECDSGRIVQVLNNLVSNGIKFSHSDSQIEIDAKSENRSIVFVVKDNGIGIPKDKQSNLFTKFYQVDTSLTRKAGGTGLGLAICKGIVEAHNGKIWLESEAGKGSTFRFSIPIIG